MLDQIPPGRIAHPEISVRVDMDDLERPARIADQRAHQIERAVMLLNVSTRDRVVLRKAALAVQENAQPRFRPWLKGAVVKPSSAIPTIGDGTEEGIKVDVEEAHGVSLQGGWKRPKQIDHSLNMADG